MAEQYVRPPLVPSEAPSATRAAWRFRLIGLVLLAALTLLVVVVFLKVANVTSEDPGLPFSLRPAGLPVAAAGR